MSEDKQVVILCLKILFLCDGISFSRRTYFPTQKFLKIFPNTSSFVISPPVISARKKRQSRMSRLRRSPERFSCRPSRTRSMALRALRRAS